MAETGIKFTLAVDDAQFKTAIDAAQNKTASMTGNLSRSMGSAGASVQSLSRHLGAMGAIAAAAFSVNKIAALTDAYASLNARVALASKGVGSAALASQQLFEIAARSRVGVEALSEVYTTLSRSASEMGASQSRVLGITETLSKAMTISGGSAEGARAAMVQFGQGMNAGALRGEELNSVLEQAPRLAQALAEGMGQPVGALKTLAAEGKITTEVVFTALERMKDRIDSEFEELPTTIGQAMTLIQNSLLQTIGVFDQANGISRGFADGLVVLSENMGTAVIAAGSLASAFVVLRYSATAATVASSALALATGALGGPVGLLVTALGLGAAAWVAWRAAGVNGEEAVKTKVVESHEEIMARIEQQTAKLVERNKLAGAPIAPVQNQTALDAGKEYADAYNKYQAVINRTGQFASIPDTARDDLIKSSGASMARTLNAYSSYASILATDAKRVTAEARDAFMSDYQAGGDKLAKQLADYDKQFLGKVSDEQRNKDLAAIRAKAPKAAADDTIKTAVDAQIALYEQLQTTVTSGEKRAQAALTASRAAGLVEDQDFYTKKRDLALGANAGMQSLVNLEIKAVESSKLAIKDKAGAVVKYNGELVKLREDEKTINAKYNNELLVAAAELAKNYAEALSKALGDGILKTNSLNAETRALEVQTQTVRLHGIAIDSTATILAREEVAILSVALATTLHNKAIAEQLGLTEQQSQNFATTIAQLTALKNVATGTAGASAGKDLAQAGLDQTERLVGNKIEDPFKDWGNTLRETFATAGDGLARMVSVMGVLAESGKDYAEEMSVINALRKEGGKSNLETASINEQALIERTRKDQVAAYASMAGAAKGFFKDGSDGYRLLNGLEQAMHLMQLANMAEKLFTSLFVTTAEVAAKTTGNTVVAASGVASDAIQLPGAVALAGARAVGAVANQGNGDPYTAFPRIAAMIAIMAGIGLMVGGGGGGAPSVTMDAFAGQKANDGTGTVLGDPSAQSESLQNSLDTLESYAKPSLLYTSQMVGLLRSINTSLAGATSSLLSSGFDAFGNQFQGTSSAKGGGIMGSIFGSSSSSTSLSDLGLSFARQSIAEAMRAVSLQQYQVTRTDSSKSGFLGFGSKSSTSYNTSFGAVDEKVSVAMTQTVQQMFMLVEKAALQIGASQSQIDALQNIDTGLGKISLKGKTGQEIQELLTSVFSAMGDAMSTAIAPGLKDMQLAGEGLLETFIRITNGLSITNTWARIFGRSLYDASIQGAAAANKLAEAFGGLERLNDQSQAFYESYYSQAEQAANSQIGVSEALASVNLSMPLTKDGFRALSNSLDLTTDAGRAAYAMLLSLAPEFSDTSDMLDELAADMAAKLVETFTGRGQLIPALSAAALALAIVSISATTTTGALSSINSILGDARSRVLYFGESVANVNAPLDAAQLATLALRNEMLDLSASASDSTVDFAGLSAALQNVDTRTFVATVTGVFEVIGERVRDVLNGIADERISVRDAAINIIGAGGMTAAQISQQITDAMVGMPSSSGLLSAQSSLTAADARAAAAAAAAAAAQGAYGNAQSQGESAISNQQNVIADTQAAIAANRVGRAAWQKDADIRATHWSWYWRVRTGESLAEVNRLDASFAVLNSALAGQQSSLVALNAAYNDSNNAYAAAAAAAAAVAGTATAAQTAAATVAKNAQLAYIASLQQYAVDAGKAVKQLGQLRQETVTYYETQKQLADLMNSSASSLRQTVADYRFGLMDPADQLAQLQERFNIAYSMALSTSGDVLAGYGSEINALINPLLQKAQEAGLSGAEYAALINTTLARADSVAARLEDLAPADYQLESLNLLAQIDATLAALESGALTADQIIVNAIKSGADTTANGLRAVIAAITGASIPAFATGGYYAGGAALVGETGPEVINFNRPGQVYAASQTRGMFAGGGNTQRLEALVENLTEELSNLRAETRAILGSSTDMAKQLKRWDGNGMPVRAAQDEIFQVELVTASA